MSMHSFPGGLEEQINALFLLSQPQNWRNRLSTPDLGFPLSLGQSPGEEQKLALKTFWNEVHLGSFAQLDFELSLSVSEDCSSSGDGSVEQGEEAMPNRKFYFNPPNDLHLSSLLRLAVDCPFLEVREQAKNALGGIEV